MDYRYIKAVIAGLIILMMAVGCEDDNDRGPAAPEAPSQLFPLQEGKFWVYDVEEFRNDSLLYRSSDTVKVDTSAVIWVGEIWFSYVGEDSIYWRNGVDGIWRLRKDLRYPGGLAEKYYVYPAQAGDCWVVESDRDSVSVVSVTEAVEVPAGRFEGCHYYRFERSDGSRLASVWACPGVGVVQESTVKTLAGDTLRSAARLRGY